MSTITPVSPSPVTPPVAASVVAIAPLFKDGAEWYRALGEVPLSRIVFDPWPGTATDADLIRLVENEDRIVELIDGTLVEKPVGYLESQIAGWLITYLNLFLEDNNLGSVTGEAGMIKLFGNRIRIPDVAFVSNDRLNGHDMAIEHAPLLSPNLAIEVLSEGNTVLEMKQKRYEYFKSGTQLVWILEPRRKTVAIYSSDSDFPDRILTEADSLDGGLVLPGFVLPLTKLFSKVSSRQK